MNKENEDNRPVTCTEEAAAATETSAPAAAEPTPDPVDPKVGVETTEAGTTGEGAPEASPADDSAAEGTETVPAAA